MSSENYNDELNLMNEIYLNYADTVCNDKTRSNEKCLKKIICFNNRIEKIKKLVDERNDIFSSFNDGLIKLKSHKYFNFCQICNKDIIQGDFIIKCFLCNKIVHGDCKKKYDSTHKFNKYCFICRKAHKEYKKDYIYTKYFDKNFKYMFN